MADTTQNVIIDLQYKETGLDAVIAKEEKLSSASGDLQSDYKKLTTTIDSATQAQQENTDAQVRAQKIYDTLAKSVIYLSGESKKMVQTLLTAAPDQLAKQMDNLGVSVDDYVQALKDEEAASKKAQAEMDNTNKKSQSLRSQYKQLVQQLALLKASGQENTQQFKDLSKQAGFLGNALDDTRTVVKNLSGDSPKVAAFGAVLKGVGTAAQGTTAAMALLGNNSEDLQAVFVKVNEVMALNQAIQEAVNLVSDEGLALTLKSLFTRGSETTGIAANTAAKEINTEASAANNTAQVEGEAAAVAETVAVEGETVAVEGATVAQKAWNLAMKANPIILFLTALAAFAAAIYEYTKHNLEAIAATEAFNDAQKKVTTDIEAQLQAIQTVLDKNNAYFDFYGQRQSEIIQRAGEATARAINARNKAIAEGNAYLASIADKDDKETIARRAQVTAEVEKLESDNQKDVTKIYEQEYAHRKAIRAEDLADAVSKAQAAVDNTSKATSAQFDAQRKLQAALQAQQTQDAANSNDTAKIKAIAAAGAQARLDINENQLKFEGAQRLAFLTAQLTNETAVRNKFGFAQSQAEIDLQKKIIQEETNDALIGRAHTEEEKIKIITDGLAKQEKLQEDFNRQQTIRNLQAAISNDNAILADITKGLDKQLDVRIDSINKGADLEILAAQGNADKIKEIEAKRDAAVLQARLAAIDYAAKYEQAAFTHAHAFELEDIDNNLKKQQALRDFSGSYFEKQSLKTFLGVEQQSTDVLKDQIDKRTQIQVAANDQTKKQITDRIAVQGAATDEDTKQLADAMAKQHDIYKAGDADKDALDAQDRQRQKEQTKAIVNGSLDGVSQGLSILSNLYAQQDAAANARLEAQKQRVQDELDAGEITAKEAKRRNTELDTEQKKLQIAQAKRQKRLAIFQAIISTAQAVVTQLSAGPVVGFVLAAIAAVLGAAQIAVIASQPLPQFDKGKKNRWSGLGEIAERRPEILERGGRMYLVTEPTVTYLNPEDKVYSPAETDRMIAANSFGENLLVDTGARAGAGAHTHAREKIDYNKMGAAIGERIVHQGTELTEDGLRAWQKKGHLTEKYLNRRHSWKK